MKQYTLYSIAGLFCLVCLSGFTQVKKKDTLYFKYDKNYTIDGDQYVNMTYAQFAADRILDMPETQTDGYIYFLKKKIFLNLRPKQVLSIKEYLERRVFYYEGKYNKIINKWKLKELLLESNIIFLVKDKEFIKPKYIGYNSYYPIGKGEEAIDKRIKDTLFFNLSGKQLYESPYVPDHYLIRNVTLEGEGSFFFEKIRVVDNINIKTNPILCAQEYIRNTIFYKEQKKVLLSDYELMEYFDNNYIIFLVKKTQDRREFIQVRANFTIE
ncbi:MAG: hypothetical protein V3U92_01430 [Cellulophaga sp.]